jgi:hypothetical protein
MALGSEPRQAPPRTQTQSTQRGGLQFTIHHRGEGGFGVTNPLSSPGTGAFAREPDFPLSKSG